MSRTTVAGSLWPDTSDTRAHASLRSAVARLDGAARDAITTSATDIGLAEGVTVDLYAARVTAHTMLRPNSRPACDDDCADATIACLSADLLPDWCDEWLVVETEEWRQLRLHALEAFAARLTSAGRFGDAIRAALAAVRADPLRESAHAALIGVHLAEGNQSEAIRSFRRYAAHLQAELALEPTARLRLLMQPLLSA
jgi:DNA-binding SARP family transcriptional activator